MSAEAVLDVCPRCAARPLFAEVPTLQAAAITEPSETSPPRRGDLEEKLGDRIGRYKLLQKIGEGGGGVVYLVEQEEPVRRRLALKVIKLGMDTLQVIARFEAERQALAMMDHPNIARVHDGGTTVTGRPYFVMELVRGIRITEYCDTNNLSTTQRLDLFIQVCLAVQHAHQKGVIHRDLKPSNILVTINDGAPVPKVIDFGVAKAIEQRLTDRTLFTEFHQFIGTPAYMSPEQALMTSLDIDTRSDIYSLGVLLYELLTGRTPLDASESLKAGLDELRRTIREKEPARPSTRLTTMRREELTAIATRRSTNPPQLIHAVSGDLDWIVMKCLEKDRTRRYDTANGLAADLKRHLQNEPIVARPPNALYTLQKLVRRHRGAFAAVGAVTAALILGLGLSLWSFYKEREAGRQAVAARHQAEANFQTARDAIDHMFTRVSAELASHPGMDKLRRELLEDALRFYQGFLQQKANDPTVRHGAALAYQRVGTIYGLLGQYDKAMEPLTQAVALLEGLARLHPAEAHFREAMADAHGDMGYASHWLRQIAQRIEHQQKRLSLYDELRRQFPTVPRYLRLTADAYVDLGNALIVAGRLREGVEQHQQALRLCEQRRGAFPNVPEDRRTLAHVQHWLGRGLEDLGRWEEAEKAYRAARELRTQLVTSEQAGEKDRFLLAHVNVYLAELLMDRRRSGEAEELLRQSVEIDKKLLSDSPDVADFRRGACLAHEIQGKLFAALGRVPEAEAALRLSLAMRERLMSDLPGIPQYRDDLAWTYYKLGVLLEATGRTEEAAKTFRSGVDILERLIDLFPQSHAFQAHLGWILATCPMPRFRDALRAVTLARNGTQSEPGSSRRWTGLGIAQYRAGDPEGAIASLNTATEAREGGDPQQWLFLAMAHWQKGDRAQAQLWHRKSVAWIEQHRPADEIYHRFRVEADAVMEAPK